MKRLIKVTTLLIVAMGTLSGQVYSQELIENFKDRGLFCQTENHVSSEEGAYAFNKVYINPENEDGVRTIDVNPEYDTLRQVKCSNVNKGLDCKGFKVDSDDLVTNVGNVRMIIDYSDTARRGGEDTVSARIFSSMKRSGFWSFLGNDLEEEEAYCEVYSLEMTKNIAKSKK